MADRPLLVAFAGARSLPLAPTAGHLLHELAKLPDGSIVLLRRPKTHGSPPGRFEILTAALAKLLSLGVEWHQPDGVDRGQTYLRDLLMVERADYLIAFFEEGAIMGGGTGHVVEAAWAKGRAVEAFTVTAEGELRYVGSFDPTMA